MKAVAVLLAVFALANANSLFLDKEEANQVLSRNKRANTGFEELQQGNLQQECYDEQCNYEEAREVFEDDAKTEAFWQVLTNQCKSSPCSEPGLAECVNIYNGHVCLCKEGFTGRMCEFEINYCENDPCSANGKCYNDPPTFKCVCEPGYKGKVCTEEVNECEFNYCPEGSTCVDGINKFECLCPPKGCTAKPKEEKPKKETPKIKGSKKIKGQ